MENEIITLKDRLDSTQRAWQSSRHEIEERETRYTTIDRELRDSSMAVRTVELQMKGFREQLASILSLEGLSPVEPHDVAIRDRVKAITMALKDKSAVSFLLYSYYCRSANFYFTFIYLFSLFCTHFKSCHLSNYFFLWGKPAQ